MLFLQRYNFTVVYRKGSSLHLTDTLSRAPCRDEATTPPCLQPFKCSECISHTWTPHRQPSQTALTNNCAKPQPHAKTCSYWHIMSSMVGLQLKNICPSNFKHSGTFEKISASLTVSSLRLLGPSSPLHYGHLCCLKFISRIEVRNIASVSQETLSFGQACPRTLKNSATPALPGLNTENKPPLSRCYRTVLRPYRGSLFRRTYSSTNTSTILSLCTTRVTSMSWTDLTPLY